MIYHKNKIYSFLFSFLLIASTNNIAFANNDYIGSTSVHDGYKGAYVSDYNYNNDEETNNSTEKDSSTDSITTPEQLLDSLKKTGTIPNGTKVIGRAKNSDGQEMIAIKTDDNSDTTMMVTVSSDGSINSKVDVLHPNTEGEATHNPYWGDSSSAQSEYDNIMKNNELKSDSDIETLNNNLHDSELINQVSSSLGTSKETTSGTATGLMSVFGLIVTGKATKKKQGVNANSINIRNTSLVPTDSIGVYNSYISDYAYENMTQGTKELLNALTAKFYAETGIVLNLTSGYRDGDGSSYHNSGLAFDVTSDSFEGDNGKYYRDLYCNMAKEFNVVPLDEYPGEPGEIYAHGSNIHVTNREP